MGNLVAVRVQASSAIPCHMHNCYNTVSYRLVHPTYADVLGMEIAYICEECAKSLVASLAKDTPAQEVHPAIDDGAYVDNLPLDSLPLPPKRGRPKK